MCDAVVIRISTDNLDERIEKAVHTIVSCWDEWDGAAQEDEQREQDPRAWYDTIEAQLRCVLLGLVIDEDPCIRDLDPICRDDVGDGSTVYDDRPQPSAAERRRTESNVTEQSRALPNKPNRSQRELPIGQVEQSDEAYLAALDSAALPDGVTAIVRWLIQDGRRESGEMRLAVRKQRQIADRVRKSASTVCESLRRLRNSGLVTEADGEYRLRLALLVEISEVAQTHREQARREVDPEEAWEALVGSGARPRSACSAALGTTSGSVEERSSTPVSVTSVSVSGSGAASRLPSAAERGERDDCLRDHVAWRQLQTRHFRDAAGKPAIAVGALQPCFYAAVEADLLDNEPEHKIRFLAAAYDLAHQIPRWDAQQRRDVGVRSPAVCLRRRVERGALFRASPEGHAWAKKIVFPGEV